MKPEWKGYAPIGLWIAGIAAVAAVALRFINLPDDLYLQIALGLVIIGLALFVMLDPDGVREMVSGRQARYGSNALVMVLAVTGILVVVNYWIAQNPQQWDLTEDKSNSLTESVREVVDSLDDPVHIQAFFTDEGGSGASSARDLLDQFELESDGLITYEFIDPISNPGAQIAAGVSGDQSLALWMDDRREVISFASETNIAEALVRLMNPADVSIYVLVGHGEIDLNAFGDQSIGTIKGEWENRNYNVASLSLLAAGEIPEDADALIAIRPLLAYSQDEILLIDEFLENGGAVIFLFDPALQNEVIASEAGLALPESDPLRVYLEEVWGIVLGDDMIFDPNTNAGNYAVGFNYARSHAITSPIVDAGNTASIFPIARSIQSVEELPAGVSHTELITTVTGSWAETNMEAVSSGDITGIAPDEDEDVIGPVPLAVVAENANTEGRVVVYGDADFMQNSSVDQYANLSVSINTMDWAVEQDQLINLNPRIPTTRLLTPPSQSYPLMIIFVAACLLPGGLLGIGVWVYFRRRRSV